ncbi:MAG: phosphoribosylformylglycinamidine cyclo-ligase [Candidatus Micrarchaeota archaeon]
MLKIPKILKMPDGMQKKNTIKTYSEAGIDLGKVKFIQDKINSIIFAGKKNALIGHYAGIMDFAKRKLAIHTDGVGSKVLVAQEMEKYDTIGIDAIAMNVNDIVCIGAFPLAGVDYLALAKEDDFLVAEIFKGLIAGANESEIEILGGETAIMPEIITGGKRPFDLAFTIIGECRKLITGNEIKPGNIIIGLQSSGLHSNGFTLARKVLNTKKWGAEMLTPTKIYSKLLLEMISRCDIKGLAHITGGAFSKLMRLNKKYGFLLNNIPKPKPIFQALYNEINNIREMYRTFNMGIGMCIITDKKYNEHIFALAKKYNTAAFLIGEVITKPGVWLEQDKRKIRLD